MVRNLCLVGAALFVSLFVAPVARAATEVSLMWEPSVGADPASQYYLEYRLEGASAWQSTIPVTLTETSVSGLQEGALYFFRAYTVVGDAVSAPTPELAVYTAPVAIQIGVQTPFTRNWLGWNIALSQPGYSTIFTGQYQIDSQGTLSFVSDRALPMAARFAVEPTAGYLRKVFDVSNVRAFNMAPPNVPGDTNSDGIINAFDAAAVSNSYGGPPPTSNPGRDPNRDGMVNAVDWSTVVANYGQVDDPLP